MTPTLKELQMVIHKLKVIESDHCYSHTGWKTKRGYCQLQFCVERVKYNIEAHRAMFMICNNLQLSKDQIVMHTCDNPSCINIKHLKLGTHNDNVQDRVIKNRSARGKANGRYIHGKYVDRYKEITK